MSQVETAGVAGHYHFTDLPHEELAAQIDRLRQEKNAVILAHNYQVPEVQDIADFTGDSLGLSVEASRTAADLIVFCGVHFMAESAKILSPEKTVLLPHLGAGCALSDSITPESLEEWKEAYPDHTVVTYVNSSAEVKAESDICCTSANAVSVVRSLDSDKVLFTPDRNLGRWVAEQVPEKEVAIYDGVCPTHDVLRQASVERTRGEHPEAVIIAHPECREGRGGRRPRGLLDDRHARRRRALSGSGDLHHRHRERHHPPAQEALPRQGVRAGRRLHRLPPALSVHEGHRAAGRLLLAR